MKAETIISLEEVLASIEKGRGPVRDPELYFFNIFGNLEALGSKDHALEASGEPDGVQGGPDGNAVKTAWPSRTVISSSRRSRPRPMSSAVFLAICATWARVSAIFAEASMPSTRRGGSWPAKPAIMPAWVLPVTLHTTIVSKKAPSSRSCCRTSTAQLAKPRPP